jgi:RING-variant domain
MICRICYGSNETLCMMPCKCTGSVGRIHKSCFMTRLNHSKNVRYCEVCHSSLTLNFARPSLKQYMLILIFLLPYLLGMKLLIQFLFKDLKVRKATYLKLAPFLQHRFCSTEFAACSSKNLQQVS